MKITSNGIKQWDKSFGGDGFDELTSMIQTADGGFLLGGQSGSGISGKKKAANIGGRDYWIVKISSDGTKQWDKTFGGYGDDIEEDFDALTSLIQTADRGFLLGGTSGSGISGNKTAANKGKGFVDFWVVKITSTGIKQWDKSFGGSYDDRLTSLLQTSDGGFLLGGYSSSGISGDKTTLGTGFTSHWIVKINSSGIKQ